MVSSAPKLSLRFNYLNRRIAYSRCDRLLLCAKLQETGELLESFLPSCRHENSSRKQSLE